MDAILPLIFTIPLVFFIVVGLLLGLSRGFKKSLVRFGVVLLSAVLAVILAMSVSADLLNTPIGELPVNVSDMLLVDGEPQSADTPLLPAIKEMLLADKDIGDLIEIAPTLVNFILVTPQVLIAEILFVVFFFLLKLLLGIPELIVTSIVFRNDKKKGKKKLRWAGLAVGAVQGLLCACVIMVPVLGSLNLVGAFIDATKTLPARNDGTKSEFVMTVEELEETFYLPATTNAGYGIMKYTGMRFLCVQTFKTLSNVTYEDTDICYFQEVEDLVPATMPLVEMLDTDFAELDEEGIEHLRVLVDALNESHLVSATIGEVVTGVAEKLKNDETILGITLPEDMDEKTNLFIHDVLDTFAHATVEEVPKDLPHIVDLVGVLVKHDVFAVEEEETSLEDLIQDKDFSVEFLDAMVHSTLLSPVAISAINDLGIDTLADTLQAPHNDAEARDIMLNYVVNALNDVLNSETEKDADKNLKTVSRLLYACANNLTEEEATVVADAILHHFTSGTEVTAESVSAFLETQNIPALKSASFSSKLLLRPSLMIGDKYLFNHMSEEERMKEINHLADSIILIFSLTDEIGEGYEDVSFDTLTPVGKMMDAMAKTQMLAPTLKNLIGLFLDTTYALQALPDPAVSLLRDKVNAGLLNYEGVFTNIAATYKMADHINVSNKNEETEEAVNSFVETIETLYKSTDETTVEIAQSIVTEEFLSNMGIPEQSAETAKEVFNTFLDEVVKTTTNENVDFKAESKAIDSVMNLVHDVTTGQTENAISKELVDAVVSSETLTNTIVSVSKNENVDMSEHFDEETLQNAEEILNEYQDSIDMSDPETAEKVNACLEALRQLIGLGASQEATE